MADELEDLVEAPEVEADAPEADAGTKPELSETERVAKEVGWTPQDQWKGDPDKWRPAADYLRKGAEINRDLRTKIDRQEQSFDERIRRSEKMAETALERQKKQLEDHYKAQMRYAASQGDLETYSAVEKARDQAIDSFDKETAPIREAVKPQGPQLPAETVAFVERNGSWFNRDSVMTGAAVALCGELQEKYGDKVPLSSIMNMVEENIRREFPHKFNGGDRPSATPQAPQKVEGGQRPIRTTAKKGWDQLPPEAKRAGVKNISQGLFGSDESKARALYASQYWDQE